MAQTRQIILILYLANSSLDSRTVAWSIFDGTGKFVHEATGNPDPPYASVLDAMKDGWRVIQVPPIPVPYPGKEYEVATFKFEFVLEKMEEIDV